MKKLLACLAIIAMVGGCAGVNQVVSTGQQVICNPDDQQKAEAQSILTFISTGVQVASLVVTVPVTVAEVQTIFGVVQAGDPGYRFAGSFGVV